MDAVIRYFFCHHDALWEDSWTYGDWRQYICKRPDGALQCARVSALPPTLGLLGICLLAMLTMVVATGPAIWARVIPFAIVGALLVVPQLLQWLFNRYLMVAVGPPQYDGRRIFDHEVRR